MSHCLETFGEEKEALEVLVRFLGHHGRNHIPEVVERLAAFGDDHRERSWAEALDAVDGAQLEHDLVDSSYYEAGVARHSVMVSHHSKDGKAFDTSANVVAKKLMEELKFTDAEHLLRSALAGFVRDLGEDHEHVAIAMINLCVCLRDQDRFAEAGALYERALEISVKRVGHWHPDVAQVLGGWASCLRQEGKCADAQPLYERAIAIWERHLGKDHVHVAELLEKLAQTFTYEERHDDAIRALERAIAIRERAAAQATEGQNSDGGDAKGFASRSDVAAGAGNGWCDTPNFKGSSLRRCPLISADF